MFLRLAAIHLPVHILKRLGNIMLPKGSCLSKKRDTMRHVQNRPQHPNPGNTWKHYLENPGDTLTYINYIACPGTILHQVVKWFKWYCKFAALCSCGTRSHTRSPTRGNKSMKKNPMYCTSVILLPGQHTWATHEPRWHKRIITHDSARQENTRRIPETVNRCQPFPNQSSVPAHAKKPCSSLIATSRFFFKPRRLFGDCRHGCAPWTWLHHGV